MFFLTCHNKSKLFKIDRISFGLCRKDSKAVLLRNITLLPLAWRITSLEHLGEDFSVSTMQGIIAAKSEYSLQVQFQPSKPVNVISHTTPSIYHTSALQKAKRKFITKNKENKPFFSVLYYVTIMV